MMPIERMRPEDFDAVFRLLARSFPAGERRDKAGQRALLADSAYHIDILRAPSGGVQALMASWDFGGFVFFEHFAVDPACRNGGIGGQMLDALLARFDKPACLEAELPETELAARRIGFYERHGFTVNADYPYFQPALTPGGSPIPLHLLTTGGTEGAGACLSLFGGRNNAELLSGAAAFAAVRDGHIVAPGELYRDGLKGENA